MKQKKNICFEIRFSEYFRELYKEQTGINIVIFYDVSDKNDIFAFAFPENDYSRFKSDEDEYFLDLLLRLKMMTISWR
jgi:hypothetical protein